jgi:23S rRNA (uracil1939-C5)-methyltransferase
VTLRVDVERMVAGGVALGRDGSGRVVLVEGALPGEVVEVAPTVDGPRSARGAVTEVVVASPARRSAHCDEVDAGCGGCDWAHVDPAAQPSLKAEVVRDALARLARRPDVPVDPGAVLPAEGYRTTVRAGVLDGRAAFHRRRSAELHLPDACPVAHPLVEEVLIEGRFPSAREVLVRCGAATGERMVVVTPSAEGATVPPGVRLVGSDELRGGRRAWIHEEVDGRRFRISAASFFQARPDGAAALADSVRDALGDIGDARVVDLYGGVGLFTGLLGARAGVLVERSAAAVADARVNLAEFGTRTVRVAVERWRPAPADLVVADPARSGLGAAGVAAVVATGALRVALVSCDPASLGRDVALLDAAGWEPTGVVLVDLFPRTHHLEAVTTLVRR